MEINTKKINDILKEQKLEAKYVQGKNPEITGSKYTGTFEFTNPLNSGLIGYSIYLRELEEGNNLYIHDFLTISDTKEKNLEELILMNEKIAISLGCKSITVEGGDLKTKKIYEKKDYKFEKNKYIGIKKIN